jgi:membrane-associated protease RseP (regulator of RpoE activity)
MLSNAFHHATLAYSMLVVVTSRASDSLGPGNTEELAEVHLRDYAAAAQEVNQWVAEALVRELTQAGHECQCGCPACSLGLCMCSPYGTNTLNQAWHETRPSEPAGGLWVRQPRRTSAAAQAGLRSGDRILAIDEQAITSDWDVPILQKAIRRHPSGDAIRLRVQRSTGELEDFTLIRP